jgi:hypothetical protein
MRLYPAKSLVPVIRERALGHLLASQVVNLSQVLFIVATATGKILRTTRNTSIAVATICPSMEKVFYQIR